LEEQIFKDADLNPNEELHEDHTEEDVVLEEGSSTSPNSCAETGP
jgi:hypothetical protein